MIKVNKTSQKLHGVVHTLSGIVHPVYLQITVSTSSVWVMKVMRQMLQLQGAVHMSSLELAKLIRRTKWQHALTSAQCLQWKTAYGMPKQAEGWVMPTCWLISKRQLLSQLLTWLFSSATMQAWRSSSLWGFIFICIWLLSCSMEPECDLISSWPSALTLSWALSSVTTPEQEWKACCEHELCGAELLNRP